MKTLIVLTTLFASLSSFAANAPKFDCTLKIFEGNALEMKIQQVMVADTEAWADTLKAQVNEPIGQKRPFEIEFTLTTFEEAEYGIMANLVIKTVDEELIIDSDARFDLEAKRIEVGGATFSPFMNARVTCVRL